MRFTDIQPGGGVTDALELLKAIAAIKTSLADIPVGLGMVTVEPEPVADDAARKVTSECAGKAANSHSDTHTKPDRAVFIVRLRQVCH